MRPVLGIVEHDEFAADRGQRIGQRFRLGSRIHCGDLDDFHAGPHRLHADGGQCRLVVRLADQFDLQLAARPHQPSDGDQQLRHHLGFLVESDDHRVDGHVRHHDTSRNENRLASDAGRDHEPEYDAGQEEQAGCDVHREKRRSGFDEKGHGDSDHQYPDCKTLPAVRHGPRRQARVAVPEPADRTGGELSPTAAEQGPTDDRRRGELQPAAQVRRARENASQRPDVEPLDGQDHMPFERSRERYRYSARRLGKQRWHVATADQEIIRIDPIDHPDPKLLGDGTAQALVIDLARSSKLGHQTGAVYACAQGHCGAKILAQPQSIENRPPSLEILRLGRLYRGWGWRTRVASVQAGTLVTKTVRRPGERCMPTKSLF